MHVWVCVCVFCVCIEVWTEPNIYSVKVIIMLQVRFLTFPTGEWQILIEYLSMLLSSLKWESSMWYFSVTLNADPVWKEKLRDGAVTKSVGK